MRQVRHNKLDRTTSGKFAALGIAFCILFLLTLALGSVEIPLSEIVSIVFGGGSENRVWSRIVLDFRLPKALTAALAGMALSAGGLQMQTLLGNPLAGPFVLGINSGASLGVAVYILSTDLSATPFFAKISAFGEFNMIVAAILGASVVLILILLASFKTGDNLVLLLIGVMLGYGAGGAVNILIYFGSLPEIQSYISWTFGSFRGVTWNQARVFIPAAAVAIVSAPFFAKSFNTLLFGEEYAKSLGINLKVLKIATIVNVAVLSGAVTAFCGPIAFIGVAVPHICRGWFDTFDHRVLFPAVIVVGGIVALSAELIAQLPGSRHALPLNAITALFGAPVAIWAILKIRHAN